MPTSHTAETLFIEGADAMAFAQAQFSSKVSDLAPGHWQFSAWLDPQGRVRTFFQLARLGDERLLLLLRGGDATTMADALRRFIFRSKVSIEALTPRTIATGAALPSHQIDTTDDQLSFGCGDHSMVILAGRSGDDAWYATQLDKGWPWIPDNLHDDLLPASISLHRLHAVAIDKGCYPGQEIVARLHFRGGNKRHLCLITLSDRAESGEALQIDSKVVGYLLNTQETDSGSNALAVLNETLVAEGNDGVLPLFDNHSTAQLISRWPA